MEKYEQMIVFLKRKAQQYREGELDFMKIGVLGDMYNTGDTRLIPMIKLYTEDKNEQVSMLAKRLLRAEGWFPVPP